MRDSYVKIIFRMAILALATLTGCGGSSDTSTASSPAVQPTALNAITGPGYSAPLPPDSLNGLSPTLDPARRVLRSIARDSGYTVNTSSREEVSLFYSTVFKSSEGIPAGWTGDVNSCNAGATSPEYKAAILRRINWFRAMAGVPASVQLDAGFNAKAQQAAMLMSANTQLSHTPPTNWVCYNAVASEAARNSNLGLGSAGIEAVSGGYMEDPGSNNAIVGHRRWLLYPQTQYMGTGDVVGSGGKLSANALWIFDANYSAPRPAVRDDFVAWPAKGYTPYTTVYPRWSFSYPKADFSNARVSMTENGLTIAAKLEPVANAAGENTLVWLPGSYTDGMKWSRPAADIFYQVVISNVVIGGQTRSFSYPVTVFDPDQNINASNALPLTGSGNLAVGQSSGYTFPPVIGATDYQWRSVTSAPWVFNDGAESGATNFQSLTSDGYAVVTTDASATGGKSFHLAHAQPVDQIFQVKPTMIGSSGSFVRFNSRLGLSSPSQSAILEASTDEGKSWKTLFRQSGQQTGTTASMGETTFSSKLVSLGQFASRSFQLRFRYEFAVGGGFYRQSTTGAGWYIDDIEIGNTEVQTSAAPVNTTTSNEFNFSAGVPGSIYLQVQPGMFGYYSDWGPFKRVSVGQQLTLDSRDCIMNWAEKTYPGTFSASPSSTSQSNAVYYFRYYTLNTSAIGFSRQDSVHYLAPGTDTAVNIGSKAQWMINSGCS